MLEVYTDGQRQPVPASGFHTKIDILGIRCRGPAPDAFKTQMEEQVRQAVAADATSSSAAQTPRAPGSASGSGSSDIGSASGGAGQLGAHWSPLRTGLRQKSQLSDSSLTVGVGPGGSQTAAALPPGSGVVVGATANTQSPVIAEVRPDPVMLQQMVEMGFARNRAARSLVATKNRGAQEAIDYLLAYGDQPGMDEPLDQSPATRPAGPPQAAAASWGTASTQQPAFDTASRFYPAIFPFSIPPPAGNDNPYEPSSQSPYGAVLCSGGAATAGAMEPAGFGGMAAPQPQLPLTAKHLSALRPLSHQYGSAPELVRSAAASPSVPGSAAGSSGSLDLVIGPSRTIGVAGIVKREQQKTAESGRAVEQAFRDLSALMSSAASMVALAEKFRGVLGVDGAPGAAAGAAGPGGEDPLLMDLETQQQLIALGISSPVTRETAGARYHIELSRQLADFLATPLQRVGGLMSLPDVYCLFNRARGAELVSPDDLLQAAKLFARAGVQGLRLRPLSSGVLVIQGPQHSEEQVCTKIAQLTTPPPPSSTVSASPAGADLLDKPPPRGNGPPLLGPGLSVSDVALALGGISVAIATEHLLMAEARGIVCRDDGPEGLRFYRNFFRQDRLDTAALMGF
ncbi:hypothetical protein Vretifemale_1894 [Volvox reticuliferus]|nr:hypothetical protein Vretifemale_1894 [Volvox reticuliferus]